MSRTPIRLDVFEEALRGVIGGAEYEEGRGPELAAIVIANHQDTNALAGGISSWLRRNFRNENSAVVVFAIARLMKLTNNRFMMVAAEALEAVPKAARELRMLPEMQNGTPDENRERLGTAIGEKFTETYQAVSSRFNNLPITGGYMAEASSLASSILSSLNGAGTHLTEGAKKILKEGAEATIAGARIVMFFIGAAALWCLFAVMMTIFAPSSIYYIAWASLVVFVGVPALLMMGGAFKDGIGTVIQAVSTGVLMFWSSTMELITFGLAAGRAITMEQGWWDINFMLVVVLVVWDRAVMALTQRLIGIPGAELQKAWAMRDGVYSEAEKKANDEYWKKQIFLTGISVSVCVAVNVVALMIFWESYQFHPLNFDLMVIISAAQLFLGATYMKKNIALWREGDSGVHMNDSAKRWNDRIFNGAQWTQILVASLGIFVLVGNHYVPDSWGTNVGNGTVRAVEVVGTGASKGIDAAESYVGSGGATSGPKQTDVVQANQPKTMTKAEKKARALEAYGGRAQCDKVGDTSYPCN